MPESDLPQEMLVIAEPHRRAESDLQLRREPLLAKLPAMQAVDITCLQVQVNVFLQQLDHILKKTPDNAGEFQLSELEVSAGVVLEAKGEVRLALLANAEAGGAINAAIKFVFKRA
jgi:hypothetical protein